MSIEDITQPEPGKERRKVIEDVISTSLSTGPSGPLHLIETPNPTYEPRGNLHVKLIMPFGSGKSSSLLDIRGRKKDVYLFQNSKLPGVTGTISKDGDYNPGATERGAGKCWLFDECHNASPDARNALLHLLEGEVATRDLGFKLKAPFRRKRRFFNVSAKEGHMEVQGRFSCLATGLYQHHKRANDDAYESRFMPIVLHMTPEDVKKASKGYKLFTVSMEPMAEHPVFEDYLKFVDMFFTTVEEIRENNQKLYENMWIKYGFLRRSICDFSRVFSWNSRGCGSVSDWERYVPYIPFFLRNYFEAGLTLSEYNVMEALKEGGKQEEIAATLGVSQPYVSDTAKKLKGVGLLL